MRFDYHTHTPLCHHAVGAPRDYLLAAQAQGLDEIGFSDHNPMPTQFDDWRMAPEDLPRYVAMIEEVRREFPNFPVRLGLECDYLPDQEAHLRWLAQQADWDFLIGSVHYITPEWDVDNPKHLKRWKEFPAEEIWTRYFNAYTRMATTGLFDFLGHPDLVKKFGIIPEGDLSRFYSGTLEAIADHGVAIEINTAGLRKEVKEIYPSRSFLEMAKKRKIPLLINSDAHAPEEVGFAFDKAFQLAKECGYTEIVRFEKRRRISVPIL